MSKEEEMKRSLEKAEVLIEPCPISSGLTGKSL